MEVHFHINIDDRILFFFKKLVSSKYFPKLLVLATLIPLAVHAAPVTIPNTFTSGTAISAAQVNANFTAVKTAVDGNRVIHAYNTGCGLGCAALVAASTNSITVNSIGITTSGAGTVSVSFNGSVECSASATATYIQLYGQITDISAAVAYGYLDGGVMLRMPLSVTIGLFNYPMHSKRVFSVPSAGTYTYYYRANNWPGGGINAACTFFGGNMSATFVPSL